MRQRAKLIVLLVVLLLFLIFILQNTEVVELRFLFWHLEASRAIVLLMSFLLGLVMGWLIKWVRR